MRDKHTWEGWITNLLSSKAKTHDETISWMVARGWETDEATQFVQTIVKNLKTIPATFSGVGDTLPSLNSNQSSQIIFMNKDPEIAIINNFISSSDATAIIELASGKIQRSKVVAANKQNVIDPHRTSSGTFLKRAEYPTVNLLMTKISEITNWPLTHFEDLQVLRYLPGEEYKAHHDWFQSVTSGAQRTGTFLIYLNDCPAGGTTSFPTLDIHSQPVQGNALFFSYAIDSEGKGDPRLLHAGTPVTEGEKWVAIVWMRQQSFWS